MANHVGLGIRSKERAWIRRHDRPKRKFFFEGKEVDLKHRQMTLNKMKNEWS